MDAEFAAQVSGVGALAEPVRRELYRFVASAPEDVSREQAAQALGIALHSAKFHLDRLVDEGLLDVTFRRLSGRSGPGAGRPSKLYRRSDRQLSVSLPERRYDLVGEVLAEAIERANAGDVAVGEAVQDVAQAEGRRIAAAADEAARPEDTEDTEGTDLERMAGVLERHGYEPRLQDGAIRLANCPFDRLARTHTELVCTLNHALIDGVLDGLGCTGLEAVLDPQPGLCCVTTRSRT